MSKRRLLDADGEEVRPGMCVSFNYGLPPVFVCAHIVERDGQLIALTPGHNPEETPARTLRRNVGDIYVSECRCAAVGALAKVFQKDRA